jgi:glutathione S-transferase
MLKLHGFPGSNYYNKVKDALLEKDIGFVEVAQVNDRSPALLQKSPLGKLPFFEFEDGTTLSESQVMLEYAERAYPHAPLLPGDPVAAAKVRELIVFMELDLELVARELYPAAFQGRSISEETKARIHRKLARGARVFGKLARFAPYIAGPEFTMADCAALVHLPLISIASKIVLRQDVLAELPVRDYLALVNQRPAAQKVNADRKAWQEQVKQRHQPRGTEVSRHGFAGIPLAAA